MFTKGVNWGLLIDEGSMLSGRYALVSAQAAVVSYNCTWLWRTLESRKVF